MAGVSLHDDCPRAIFTPEIGSDGTEIWVWRCFRCSGVLGVGGPGIGVTLGAKLKPLNEKRDDLPTFGIPQREITGRGSARGRWRGQAAGALGEFVNIAELRPIFVYCPRAGTCGKGQHLHVDAVV